MAEEAPAVEETEDTPESPEAEAPEQGTPEAGEETQAPEVDYEKRFNDLYPELTKSQQEAAQYRRLVEAASDRNHPQHSEALGILGLEVGEEDTEYLDEDEELKQRLEALEGKLSEKDEQARQDAFQQAEADFLDEKISELEKRENREFSDHEVQLLVSAATANRADDGEPQIGAAFEILKNVLDTNREAYLKSKRTAQAPTGASASQSIDMDDREQRRDHMARRIAQADQPA